MLFVETVAAAARMVRLTELAKLSGAYRPKLPSHKLSSQSHTYSPSHSHSSQARLYHPNHRLTPSLHLTHTLARLAYTTLTIV